MTDTLQFEIHDAVALLRIDDGKVNAITPALAQEMIDLLARARAEAKALVILGRPGKFSAGFDLRVLMGGPESALGLLRVGLELFLGVFEHPQPVVAAVSGHALAGGNLLSAVCDLRIGADGPFKIGLNEVVAGLPVPIFAQELARARLSPQHFDESVLRARIYSPAEAVEVGWLDRLVPPDELETAALEAATALAKLPAHPYVRTKSSSRRRLVEHVRATFEDDLQALFA